MKNAKDFSGHKLLISLVNAADGHWATVGGVLGITHAAASARFRRERNSLKTMRRRIDELEKKIEDAKKRISRRNQLRKKGIDLTKIDLDDPLWAQCFKRKRGALVRLAHAELQTESPGAPPTDDYIRAVLARVDELAALRESERQVRFDAMRVI